MRTAPSDQPPQAGWPLWIHAFAWSSLLALSIGLVLVVWKHPAGDIWGGWAESTELRRPVYAERVQLEAAIRTRSNTWSNLAYVLVGVYALGLGWHDLRTTHPTQAGYLVRTPALSGLFGFACGYLGFGSGLFHASLTRLGQQLDVAAMYSPLVVLVAINLGRWMPKFILGNEGPKIPTWPFLTGLALVGCWLLYQYKWSMRSSIVLPALILLVFAFAMLDRLQSRSRFTPGWLLGSAVALAVARKCWLMDAAGKFSGPDSWLQGHALWHLLTALSLACIYLYYRSEVSVMPPVPADHKHQAS